MVARSTEIAAGVPVGPRTVALVRLFLTLASLKPNTDGAVSSLIETRVPAVGVASPVPIPKVAAVLGPLPLTVMFWPAAGLPLEHDLGVDRGRGDERAEIRLQQEFAVVVAEDGYVGRVDRIARVHWVAGRPMQVVHGVAVQAGEQRRRSGQRFFLGPGAGPEATARMIRRREVERHRPVPLLRQPSRRDEGRFVRDIDERFLVAEVRVG